MVEIIAPQPSPSATFMRPYAPSWFDRFKERIDRQRIPLWLFYGALALIPVLVQLVIQWTGGVDALYLFPLFYVSAAAYELALIHYLDKVAVQALARFRPLLPINDVEYNVLLYRLTTLPARPALLAALVGALYGLWTMLLLPFPILVHELHFADTSLSIHFSQVFTLFAGGVGGLLVYHTFHQLRTVAQIYNRHLKIDLYELPPLYAFSALSAQTTIGIAFIIYLTYLAAPTLFNVDTARVGVMFFIGFLLLTFVLPLRGAHTLLVEEKDRRRSENGKRQTAAITELHRRIDEGEMVDMDSLNKTMACLEIEHATLDRISTWPWRSDTVRAVALALFFPLMVWLTQWILQHILSA